MTVSVKMTVDDCIAWENAMQERLKARIDAEGANLSIDEYLELTTRLRMYACVRELRRMYPGLTPLRGRGAPGWVETFCLLVDGKIVNELMGLPNP